MVGLGGLEPPTSPLSGARSSHLSYRPQHRGGTLHKYLIVRWFNVFRKCAESSLRYKTATFPIHLLCTIANSRFRPSWNIQPRRYTAKRTSPTVRELSLKRLRDRCHLSL